MSGLITLQRRIAEAGRIRIGQQVASSNGKARPSKLETFRLTSADRRRIDQLAELYGGEVSEWDAPSGKQWQVVTKTDALDVIVPPSDLAFSQWYELWSAGGCQRRCDGATETIGERACVCDPDNRECDIHTRLSVLLRDLPGLGVWRIDTSGYYAAVELASAVEIIQLAAGRGALLPARLRLEQRSVKRPGANGRPQTLRFAVPVLDVEVTPAQLLSGGAQPLALAEATEGRPKLTPVPQLTNEALAPSIAEQSAAPTERPRRANAAPEIPASGRSRRRPIEQPAQEETAAPEADTTGAESDSPAPADPRPRKAQAAADEDDPEYWMKRVHAAARERGLDHDALRLIAAAELGIEPGDVDAFSSKDLVADEFRQIDSLLRSLPEEMKGEDAATDIAELTGRWIFQRAWTKGLREWEAIDVVVVAGTGKQPEALTAGEWIAWAIRLTNGEYDAQRGAA